MASSWKRVPLAHRRRPVPATGPASRARAVSAPRQPASLRQASWVLLVASALPFACRGASAQPAQEPLARSWTLATWVQGAYQTRSGRLATKPSNLPDLPLANSVTDLADAFVLTGGIDVGFPAHRLAVRLGFETTTGAEAASRLGVCEVAEGSICEPEVAPASISGVTAELRVYRGNPEWPVQPVLAGGVGWRVISFEEPDCRLRARGESRIKCQLNSDAFRGGSSGHVVFRGAAGVRATRGRAGLEMTLGVSTGKFSGGTEQVNGNWYTDVRIALAASLQVF